MQPETRKLIALVETLTPAARADVLDLVESYRAKVPGAVAVSVPLSPAASGATRHRPE